MSASSAQRHVKKKKKNPITFHVLETLTVVFLVNDRNVTGKCVSD